jgi:benzoylformate decarboxylase
MNLFRVFLYQEPACPIPEGCRLIQLDANAWELGKNYPVEVGLLGDPQAGLAELVGRLSESYPPAQVREAAERRERYAARRAAEKSELLAEIEAQWEQRPMTPFALMGALSRALPPDAAVVVEAPTTHNLLLGRLGVLKDPSGRLSHRGWALGWGVGSAIGAKLAWPDRPVMALLGDGATLYGVQGLWTAAHHRVPVTFVIANNRQYKILKRTGAVLELPHIARGEYLAMDLVEPPVDFVGLARSFGVRAHRVTEPDELSQQVRDSLGRSEPTLLDVQIER